MSRKRAHQDTPEEDVAETPSPASPTTADGRNPWTGKRYSQKYYDILRTRQCLPVYDAKTKIQKLVQKYQVTLLVGETGSGKTTQVPQFVLDLHPEKLIGCTQPRRVAAMSVSERVADEMDVKLGEEVGYSIRFDDKWDREKTRIKYLTDGMLLREAMIDPLLSQYSVLILDEAHERTVATDIMLGAIKELLPKRPDLRVIVMSATLEQKKFQQFFPEAPTITISGRMYGVELYHARTPEAHYLEAAIRTATQIHLYEGPGDILIFLCGEDEIETACERLTYSMQTAKANATHDRNNTEAEDWAEEKRHQAFPDVEPEDELIDPDTGKPMPKMKGHKSQKLIDEEEQLALDAPSSPTEVHAHPRRMPGPVEVYPLYSALPPQQQKNVFKDMPPGTRKIVVATNIAETSLTIDGIVYVIDCGFSKQKVYNPKRRVESLLVTAISQASAQQRMGRAGRTRPGKCFRLYTKQAFQTLLIPQTHPEILRCNLGDVVLHMKKMGVHDLVHFDFIDPPAPQTLMRALETLNYLGAIDDDGDLTEAGDQMSLFPVEPEMAAMLLYSPEYKCTTECCKIAAMLSIQNPYFSNAKDRASLRAKEQWYHQTGDHLAMLSTFEAYEANGKSGTWCHENYLNPRAMSQASSIARQLLRIAKSQLNLDMSSDPTQDRQFANNIRRALLRGYFTKVAMALPTKNQYKTLKDDCKAIIFPGSFLNRRPQFIIYNELVLTSNNYLRTVTAVSDDWLLDGPHPGYFAVEEFEDDPAVCQVIQNLHRNAKRKGISK